MPLTITPASVLPGTGAKTATGTAGASIAQGMPVYKDAEDSNKIKLCVANGSVEEAACIGIALDEATAGQPVVYQKTNGQLILGDILTAGQVYCVAGDENASGDICTVAELESTADGEHYTTVLGIAISDTILNLQINASGVTMPGS